MVRVRLNRERAESPTTAPFESVFVLSLSSLSSLVLVLVVAKMVGFQNVVSKRTIGNKQTFVVSVVVIIEMCRGCVWWYCSFLPNPPNGAAMVHRRCVFHRPSSHPYRHHHSHRLHLLPPSVLLSFKDLLRETYKTTPCGYLPPP